ncbi:MAG: hypothetical protein E5W43_29430, partial [Mesorhizobium sp.]
MEIPAIVKCADRERAGGARNLDGYSDSVASLDGGGKNDLADDRVLGGIQNEIGYMLGGVADGQNAPNGHIH